MNGPIVWPIANETNSIMPFTVAPNININIILIPDDEVAALRKHIAKAARKGKQSVSYQYGRTNLNSSVVDTREIVGKFSGKCIIHNSTHKT